MHSFTFESIENFEVTAYVMCHQCSCGSSFEISVEETSITIDTVSLLFRDLHLLICQNCQYAAIPINSSQLIRTAYDQAIEYGRTGGVFKRTAYRKKFNYCVEQNFLYDHYDYYNIPGLAFDEEHDVEGFLTPVYFNRKAFQQFFLDDDYRVDLGAETYGSFRMKDEWEAPFGINCNGNVVLWLGDLSYMDNETLSKMKPYNIESDHKLISTEFYAGQMCCIFAEANREYHIYQLRNELYDLIKAKYGVKLDHLPDETRLQMENYSKPIIVNSKTFPGTVAVLHQILIESVQIDELRKLYVSLLSPAGEQYKNLKAIKLYEGILQSIINNDDQVGEIIAPLYLLNDLRICYDHLLPGHDLKEKQRNIVKTLGLSSFDDVANLYDQLLGRLTIFYEYMVIGFSGASIASKS